MKIGSMIIWLVLISSTFTFAQNYKLVWSDEFSGTTLDLSKWSYEIGNGSNGWGNNELEYYTSRSQNVSVGNGYLAITAQKESYSGFNYTSARIKTQGKFSFKYGKAEARIKLPYGNGMWPAFWMLGDNISTVGWPSCGEIDIMEMIGGTGVGNTGTQLSDSTVYGTLHWNQNGHVQSGGKISLRSGRFADEFHLFGVIWTPQNVKFYVDSTIYYQVDISSAGMSAFQNNFFLILNLAVGGNWPGYPNSSTVFPQTMLVDYVRVYQDVSQDTAVYPTARIESPKNNALFSPYVDIPIIVSAFVNSGKIRKVDFFQDEMKIGETYVSPYAMQWHNVFPGSYRLHSIAYASNGFSSYSDTVLVNVTGHALTSPFGGTAAKIPGVIEVEDYDLGGQGKAYFDVDSVNHGAQYRLNDYVDIEACSDTGGGYDVGWTESGEWLLYTVNVSHSGEYHVRIRCASGSGHQSTIHFEVDSVNVTGFLKIPDTGGWQSWRTIYSPTFRLDSGVHFVRLCVDSGGCNLNKFYIVAPDASPSINMIFPKGGETFFPDSVVELRWESPMVDQVMIGFSPNGIGNWTLIQDSVAARFGVYRWIVPNIMSRSCRLLVMNENNRSVSDTCNPFSIELISSVKSVSGQAYDYFLGQNFPNPFNPVTSIVYSVPRDTFVNLEVYDIAGRKVATLVKGFVRAGTHKVLFNGDKLTSGVYICKLRSDDFQKISKMALIK
ncbi:MAG: family 16 glycosylhydrolase [Candidatus Kryptoniota bacterium]